MTIITAITGASGAVYARAFLRRLTAAGASVHLIISPNGRRLLHDELGMETVDLAALTGVPEPPVQLHQYNDVGATIASGSFPHDGMVIVPCSSNTLAQIAHGLAGNLIARAAAVTLKERRRLVLCHREMPLSPLDVANYKTLTDAGAIIAPAAPGFYMNPVSIDDLADFVAGRLLDLVGVPHTARTQWTGRVRS